MICIDRLFKQAIRQAIVHHANEPVRSVDEAIAHMTVERRSNYMTVAKDMLRINNRLLESEEYSPIDVNTFMEGLHYMGRFRFMNKVKTGLAAPFQLWSWMRGNSSGIATHFLWKIPPKNHIQARADGERKSAAIIGNFFLICEFIAALLRIRCIRLNSAGGFVDTSVDAALLNI